MSHLPHEVLVKVLSQLNAEQPVPVVTLRAVVCDLFDAYREITRLNAERVKDENMISHLNSRLVCMCGEPADHPIGELGHKGQSTYDYELDMTRWQRDRLKEVVERMVKNGTEALLVQEDTHEPKAEA